jgi:hypothetical protein
LSNSLDRGAGLVLTVPQANHGAWIGLASAIVRFQSRDREGSMVAYFREQGWKRLRAGKFVPEAPREPAFEMRCTNSTGRGLSLVTPGEIGRSGADASLLPAAPEAVADVLGETA